MAEGRRFKPFQRLYTFCPCSLVVKLQFCKLVSVDSIPTKGSEFNGSLAIMAIAAGC